MTRLGLRFAILFLVALAVAGTAFPVLADDPPPDPAPVSAYSDNRPFLLIVNTAERKIFTYKMETATGGHVMLNSHRDYTYDLALDEWPPAKGRGGRLARTEDVENAIRKSEDYRKAIEEKKAKDVDSFVTDVLKIKDAKGKTLVVAGNTQGVEADGVIQVPVYRQVFIYITDHANHKILVYQIDGDKLVFVAVRKVEYDVKLPNSGDYTSYISLEEIKRKFTEWEKKQKEKKAKEAGK